MSPLERRLEQASQALIAVLATFMWGAAILGVLLGMARWWMERLQ